MSLGLVFEVAWKSLEILEAELLRDGEHLGFVFLHFVEADLVNLVGGEIGGGGAANEELVVLCAVGKGRDAGLRRGRQGCS